MLATPFDYTFGKICQIIQPKEATIASEDTIRQLLTDSRKLLNPSETIFFAVAGKQNGHRFIGELYQKGVRNFIVSEPIEVTQWPEANVAVVKSSVLALQQLAAYHRRLFHYPVMGITGSNGKTIVKEWLYQLLSPDQHIVRSPKSYNSQIGVPLSVWNMAPSYTLGIFEAGISKPGEMDALREIIQPDIGILTNIGAAHDEGFTSRTEKATEKMSLFQNAAMVIYSRDYYDQELAGSVFTWSFKMPADLSVTSYNTGPFTTIIQALYRGELIEIEIPFTDKASIENAVICWSVLLNMRYEADEIGRRMRLLSPIAMRLELKQAINNCSLINDSYSFDLPSLGIAVDFLNQQTQHPKKTVILSDMFGSDLAPDTLYREIAALLRQKGVNRMIGIGETITEYGDFFTLEKEFYPDTTSFIHAFDNFKFQNEAILLKGARKFEFEHIGRLFERKVHDTVLEINLNAVISNYNLYKSLLKPNTKIMAMVKAFSYGSASFEVASILQYHRVDYLAVAYLDEAISLRNAGIETPILVMNPEISTFSSLVKYRLEPELYSFRILNEFTKFLKAEGIAAFPVQLKIDTGMHRLGFVEEDIDGLVVFLTHEKSLRITGVFSHLTSSESPEEDAVTHQQIALFSSISNRIRPVRDYPILFHLANSSGITRFPQAQLDMVRVGIGLYGLGHGPDNTPLQHVATLKTSISQIKHLKIGESVGYNRRGVVHRPSRIATVKVGYADGFKRALGNGKGYMLVKGSPAPVIGNVCMDMTMIDVTDIACEETDEVIVFNEELKVSTLAKLLDTNEYEVISGISQRVKRIYYFE